MKIVIVHRSDPSGTTYIFTEYLNKTNREWQTGVGFGKSVCWPVGLGVEGNKQVAETIKRISGSIGYTELNYAQNNKMTTAALQNRAGKFVVPATNNICLSMRTPVPSDLRMSLSDSGDPNDYPIGSFSWIVVYKDQSINSPTLEDARALQTLLLWMVKDGQAYNEALGYSAIPTSVATQAQRLILSMTYRQTKIRE